MLGVRDTCEGRSTCMHVCAGTNRGTDPDGGSPPAFPVGPS